MSDDKRGKRDSQRVGSVVPEDPELTTWLHGLWARNEPPSRLEVHQVFGQNKSQYGQVIHHVDFKANDKLDQERATKLCNEIYAAAMNDCNSVARKSWYVIHIIDMYRKSQPLVRRLGPLMPSRDFLVKNGEEDEEDLPLDARVQAHKYIETCFEQIKWDKNRYDRVMGELLGMMRDMVLRQQTHIDSMQVRNLDMNEKLQDSKDREADRALARGWSELKLTVARDGTRMVRNLVPAIFGAVMDEATKSSPSAQTSAAKPAEASQALATPTPAKRGSFSVARALVDFFLNDCEETGVLEKLFGQWTEQEDGQVAPVADKPGIFSPAQFAILVSVRSGNLTPDALMRLLPDSEDEHAITVDQVIRSQQLLTEGTGQALKELFELLRNQRAQSAQQKGDAI